MNQAQLPIVISGPSGVGKGTLISRLLERHPKVFATTRSHTTRKPRPRELESEDNTYHFVSFAEFKSLVYQNAFAENTFFSGNHYGTSWQTIQEQEGKEKIPILDIDMNGIKNIREERVAVRCAFISPPNLQLLEDRLRGRGTEADANIRARLARAGQEMEFADSRGADDILIINDDLDAAYRRLEEWALRGLELYEETSTHFKK